MDEVTEKYNKIQGDFYFESFKNDPFIPRPHYHENYEIYLLISGKCCYHFANECYELLPGEMIITEPYIPHRVQYDSYDSENVRFVVNIHPRFLLQYYSEDVVKSFFENIENAVKFKLSEEEYDLFMEYAKELDSEVKKKKIPTSTCHWAAYLH